MTLEEFCEVMHVTKPTGIKILKRDKRIRAIRAGRKWIISTQSVRDLLGDSPSMNDLILRGK